MKIKKEQMLEEFLKVRPEILSDNAKLLFDVIMEEFDKRDEYKIKLNKIEACCKEMMDNYLEEDDCEYCDGKYAQASLIMKIIRGKDYENNKKQNKV